MDKKTLFNLKKRIASLILVGATSISFTGCNNNQTKEWKTLNAEYSYYIVELDSLINNFLEVPKSIQEKKEIKEQLDKVKEYFSDSTIVTTEENILIKENYKTVTLYKLKDNSLNDCGEISLKYGKNGLTITQGINDSINNKITQLSIYYRYKNDEFVGTDVTKYIKNNDRAFMYSITTNTTNTSEMVEIKSVDDNLVATLLRIDDLQLNDLIINGNHIALNSEYYEVAKRKMLDYISNDNIENYFIDNEEYITEKLSKVTTGSNVDEIINKIESDNKLLIK